jgi:hypothetical protein
MTVVDIALLQLEVGALAARGGYTVACEDRVRPRAPPSDVVLRCDEHTLRIETFAIIRDKRSQEKAAYWERLLFDVKQIEWRHDTPISGVIPKQLDDAASAELLRLVEQAAQQTAATNEEHVVSWQSAELRVLPTGTTDWQLEAGAEESIGWPRVAGKLRQKAKQAQASGSSWLRADILDGTWQFTPWARASLRAKIDEMARQVQPLLSQVAGISGVALSSGAGVAQGQFVGESARSIGECYGLRRVLPAVRVRETMIVPVSAAGREQARLLVDLYGAEESWLDWALDRFGLPAWSELRP